MNPQASEKKWEQLCLRDKTGELYKIQTFDHFVSWLKAHPELNIDDPVGYWEGKKIIDSYIEKHHDSQMQTTGEIDGQSLPGELSSLSTLFLIPFMRKRIVLIEDDVKYQKLAEEQKEIWKKENNSEDFNSKEGVDYLYGNLDDPDAPSLGKNIKKAAENDPQKKKILEELEKKYSKEKQKIYKDPNDDPRLARTKELIEEEAEKRHEVLKKENPQIKFEEVHEKVKTKRWGEFVKEHPQKTKAYLEKHEEIKKAVDSLENQKKQVPNKNPMLGKVNIRAGGPINRRPISIDDFKKRLNKNQPRKEEEDVVIDKHSGHTYDPDTGRVEIREIGQSHDTPPIEVIETRTPRRTPSQPSSDNMPQPSQPSPAGQPHKGGGGPPRRGGGAKGMPGGLPNIGNLSKLGKMAKFAPFFLNPYVWAGILILIFLLAFIGVWQGLNNTTPVEAGPVTGGSGCPTKEVLSQNRNPSSCRYLNPSIGLFDMSISQNSVNSYIEKHSPVFINAGKGDKNEFIRRVNYIVGSSKKGGLNPAIFLACWKSESAFGTMSTREMGCAGDGFYEQVNCALAINEFSDERKNPIANCARSRDANSVSCNALKSIRTMFDKSHPINYPVSTFDDFAEAYGPYDHLVNGEPTNCTNTYNTLVEVVEDLGMCSSTPAGGSKITPPPINPATLRQDIGNQFNMEFDANFNTIVLTWAWEVLWKAKGETPNFFTMLKNKNGGSVIFLTVTNGTGNAGNNTIAFSNNSGGPLSNPFFFKQNLIHELSHIIHGTRGDPLYKNGITTAFENDGGFISAYALGATSGAGACNTRNSGELEVQLDEDFAETLSYYINNNVPEQNYSNNCKPTNSSINPFSTGKYPNHLRFVKSLLGGNNF